MCSDILKRWKHKQLNRALSHWIDVHKHERYLSSVRQRIVIRWTKLQLVRYEWKIVPCRQQTIIVFIGHALTWSSSLPSVLTQMFAYCRGFEKWRETFRERRRFECLIGNTLWRKGQQTIALAFDDWLEHAINQKKDQALDLIP